MLEAIGRVFTSHPFALTLRDTVGGHPLDGGILLFDVPMIRTGQMMTGESATINPFSYRMTQIEMDRLNVVLKPVGSPANACEVTVYGDLRKGLRKNWVTDKWISGSAAVGGAAAGTAVGIAALSLGALSVLTAAGGAAVLGGLTLLGYRARYRHALRKSQDEVATLLAALESAIRAAKVFGSPPPPNAPPPSGRADDSLLIVA